MSELTFIEQAVTERDKQSLRIHRFLIASATYVAAIAVVGLGTVLGLWPLQVLVTYALYVAGASVLFYVVFITGWNQRLADPSLTVPQIMVAISALLYVAYHAGPARGIVLLWVLMIFMFAVFRLRTAQLWPIAALTWVAYGAVVGLLLRHHADGLSLNLEIFQWVGLGVVLGWFTFMGGHVSDMRAKLHRNEALYRSTWETAHDAILVIGPKGVIRYANPAVLGVLGHAPEALVGEPITRLLSAGAATADADLFRQYLEGGEKTRKWDAAELMLIREDGHEFPAEVSVGETTVEQQRACVLFIHDITARKQTEQALVTARVEAESANRVKGQFLTNMTHEIRTPLNGIIGLSEILSHQPLNRTARGYVEKVQRAGNALLRVVDDVLDFSKIEAGQLDVERVVFDLPALLDEIYDLYAESARAKNIALHWDISRALPQFVFGDPARLRQVLSNLVGNAIKFTDQGQVALNAAPDGSDSVRFEVRDTGVGIPIDKQKVIFDPFSQADGTTTRRFGGAGLGLTITRQVVVLMGGEIGVDSEPGKGSRFWVTTPLPRSAQRPIAAAAGMPPVATSHLQGRRVLLVEDDESNAEIAKILINMLGPDVTHVTNGALAVAAVREARYDLVFMDCQMPVMDGLEATRQVRAMERASSGSYTPIVAFTAHSFDGYREQCLNAGMDDFITKPARTEEFAAALNRWLRPPQAMRAE